MVSSESSDSQYLWSASNVISQQNKEDVALGMTKVNADGSHGRQTELGWTQKAEKATLLFTFMGRPIQCVRALEQQRLCAVRTT